MSLTIAVDRFSEIRPFLICRQQSIGTSLFYVLACLLVAIWGCKRPETANWVANGFLDPTQVGQFREPKRNPIRHSLSLLEEPMHLETAEAPIAEDLVPDYEEPKIQGGDTITVTIMELQGPSQETSQQIRVGDGGFITLPVLGPLRVVGLTPREIELEIKLQLRAKEILEDADVQVRVVEARAMMYSILGQVPRPGAYPILIREFRLLNALANAGGVPPELHELFVIRKGAAKEARPGTAPAVEPAHRHKHMSANVNREPSDPIAVQSGTAKSHASRKNPPQSVLLHEHGTSSTSQPSSNRVIEIDVEELMNGVPAQNIIIRPLDLVYVSHGAMGEYHMAGNVARPGAYEIHGHGPTLKQAIASAGGFGPLAWPARAEIVRRIDEHEEVTIQVDLDAIFAGTDADVMLRPNDLVNVGTTDLSPFLLTLRNAFRLSYGFGFVYDRNFADSDTAQAREQAKSRRLQKAQTRGLPIR